MRSSFNSLPQLSPVKLLGSPVGYNPLYSFNAGTPAEFTKRLPSLNERSSAASISLKETRLSTWGAQRTPEFKPAEVQQSVVSGHIGLRNLGNTSFLSAVLQCLLRAPHFTEFFSDLDKVKSQLSVKNKLKWRLALHLHRLILAITQADGPTSPFMINNVMKLIAPQFASRFPVDCADFLRSFLDALHQDLNRVRKLPPKPCLSTSFRTGVATVAREWWQYSLQCANSKITDLFQGQVVTILTCTSCKEKSVTCESFLDLSLPVPEGIIVPRPTLQDCLRTSMKEHILPQHRCSKCKKVGRTRQETSLHRLPPVLVIHLQRFKATALNQKAKLTANIGLPEFIDMTSFTSYSESNPHYRLFGVIHHRGSWGVGQYVAECFDGVTWKLFEDSKVYSAETPTGSSTAYILFYSQYEPELLDESMMNDLE